eukprot:CAMPEP_0177633574 /NCGR_PEP_ID=MMETSP0447-20121125/2911_1 /TAXON_ID=0 /ORGANISM="Stygamoeba regulata, Strain BSH-02190019" /LENGTH=62 /DNA_ID=CAMNT_0019135245 /DNA_START=338 /DNA_END=522 /DNA_ORIENTATION=+
MSSGAVCPHEGGIIEAEELQQDGLPHLPVEIWEKIFLNLTDPWDLISVAFTSGGRESFACSL